MTVAQRERAALVTTMRGVGPERPTLCGDWTTRDLAAHLVIRERRIDAAPGIMVPAFAGYTERVQNQVAAENDWNVLLDKIASGPPLLSPFKLLDPFVNVAEMFIHHEDVRRAESGWEPRVLDDETTSALARQVGLMSRMTLSKAPVQVSLRTPAGKTLATVGKGPAVVATGEPGELLLFISGRDEARITFTGDDDAVAALQDSSRGL
ncbi:TIGR03085 family metal-binding protein [Mycolicibacterium sp. 050158]|uniref:TIGR03085 family metal-binding protein n=1 Tax=Mycolicibacterium sp. 050158 TaxID=3090602 RepID=UPI00299D0F2C|nr:TIGR03085 family metal-binding protein [Mycolicibacterium sp. 050158]MDX1892752.1 TIGR03085 family metal-binding protein [Mycolicibacterium sp. 050158]